MTYLVPILSVIVIAGLIAIIFYQRKQLRKLSEGKPAPSDGTVMLSDAVNADVNSDALFATLSHELRTPLNGLLGIVQMLNEERDDEDIYAIEGCARHMLAVVSTLVNHSKIQAEWDDLPEYREWVSPYELMEQIKRHINFRAGLRGLELQLIHQNKTQRLRGDTNHLRNIIENAILGSLEAGFLWLRSLRIQRRSRLNGSAQRMKLKFRFIIR